MAEVVGMNLVQKLAKIREMSDVVQKSKKGFNYRYADITDILAKITSGMKKYGVSLMPSIVPGTSNVSQVVSVNTKVDKTGKPFDSTTTEMLVTADMVFKWVDNDNPADTIEVPWVLTGQQGDPSQALGSSLTYTTRQFLTAFFQIAQSDSDVDAYRSKQKEAEVAEDKAVAEAIISEFDRLCKTFLADNQNKSDEVKKFIGKYVKGSNYFSITEPTLAAKLLGDFKNTYIKGE